MTTMSLPPFEMNASTEPLQTAIDRARSTMSGTGGTITVGRYAIPVERWEMMADDEREDEARVFRGIPDGETPRDIPSKTGSFTAYFTGTWGPVPRQFVARSRRRVNGVWVTVKAY